MGLEMSGTEMREWRTARVLAIYLSWLALSLAILAVALLCSAGPAFAVSYSVSRFGEHFFGINTEAGLLQGPVGVAVDAAGNSYVADRFDHRIDKFSPEGKFLLAWGWGVLNGEDKLQVCTVTCQDGLSGSRAGQFNQPQGVAVDGSGNVYVVDLGNHRIEKFSLNGEFELTFGGEVNKRGGDVCTKAEESECQAGVEGTGNGQFGKWAESRSYIAVGPLGNVYVGDIGRVQIFESDGVFVESVPPVGTLSSTGEIVAIAVNSAGDVFVKIGDKGYPSFPPDEVGAQPGVREFEPVASKLWVESSVQFDVGSESVEALAVNASGDRLYVGDFGETMGHLGHFHILEYEVPSGKEVAEFGFGTAPDSLGMAFSNAFGVDKLYVVSVPESERAAFSDLVWDYTVPGAGPLIEPSTEKVVPESRGAATFMATVDPEGSPTEVKVEYVDNVHFQSGGFSGAVSSEPVVIGSGFADQQVEIKLGIGKLMPGENYHYRIAAFNSKGMANGEGEPFVELPAAVIEGPWASEVSSTGVTLSARINPGGVATSYKLEYGTSTSYGTVLPGNVGEGNKYVLVSFHRQGLAPGTVFHFRLVTTNMIGTVETVDHTFMTQPALVSAGLPDSRMWELVSPANKHGALIEPVEGRAGDLQAAIDGTSIGYVANEPVTCCPPGNAGVYVLSKKRNEGWGSFEILPSQSLPEGEIIVGELSHGGTFPMLFSPDMSGSVIEPDASVPVSSLTPVCPGASPATERTIVLRSGFSEACYVPLVTAANVSPSENKFGGKESLAQQMQFLSASPDLSHVVFVTPFALTPGAVSLVKNKRECVFHEACQHYEDNLYEWSGGLLRQVNILPESEGGGPTFFAFLGHQDFDVLHTVSNDGRWVVWEYEEREAGVEKLYVRDMVAGKTLRVGGAHTTYETMSSNGSRLFFLEGQRVNGVVTNDLYVLDTTTGVVTDVTANHGPGESSAGVQDTVLGSSEDGTYVYFVATGALSNGAISGKNNLYLAREEGGTWSLKLVAVLSPADVKDWSALTEESQHEEGITSRVSPDGRLLAFMSDKPLTGYDNTDVNSGLPDEEVYEYDSISGNLVCVSCNPSGARPAGVFDPGAGIGSLLVDRPGAWAGHWLAGSMSGWRVVEGLLPVYQPRNLSNSGRLFFESPDALVSGDTNGLEDVYEYEPLKGPEGPSSDNCTAASPGFSERLSGCVGLISSGTSSSESAFYDASGSGDDAFFVTASKLVPADYDNSVDVYDAHSCLVPPPCVTEPVGPPACSSGDSCKPPPSVLPEVFGPPPSETFSGEGNTVPEASKHKASAKSLTSERRLMRALRACRKKHSRNRRIACERAERNRYGAHSTGRGKKSANRGKRRGVR